MSRSRISIATQPSRWVIAVRSAVETEVQIVAVEVGVRAVAAAVEAVAVVAVVRDAAVMAAEATVGEGTKTS